MPRYLLCLGYDGTHFSGWQQQNDQRTVQQCLQEALAYFNEEVKVTGAGRTDTGVHALRQFASFDLSKNLNNNQMVAALNSRLPADVRIWQSWQVMPDFSARYDALSRSYEYHLTTKRTPFNRLYAAYLPSCRLQREIIEKCLPLFLGELDFTSFAKHNPASRQQRCCVSEFTLECQPELLIFRIRSNRFLHNMVRRLVGTCIRIGHLGKDPQTATQLLAARNPSSDLIFTAPPEGLYLADVEYEFLKPY